MGWVREREERPEKGWRECVQREIVTWLFTPSKPVRLYQGGNGRDREWIESEGISRRSEWDREREGGGGDI